MIKNRIIKIKRISPKTKIENRKIKKAKSDLLKEISFYNETIAKIDLEIEELNKLFSN